MRARAPGPALLELVELEGRLVARPAPGASLPVGPALLLDHEFAGGRRLVAWIGEGEPPAR